MGTPSALYDQRGHVAWAMQLDAYGRVRRGQGQAEDCPFRYQGQYEDAETGLYYNRFRYYDPEMGSYVSQDPLRWRGGGRLYAYVANTCAWIDELGLNRATVNNVLEIKQKFPAGSPEAIELRNFAGAWNREIANAGGSMTRQAVPKSTPSARSVCTTCWLQVERVPKHDQIGHQV